MELRDRLKQLGVVRGPSALKTSPPPKPADVPRSPRRGARLEDLVPGVLRDTVYGPCYVVEDAHPAEHVHGPVPLAEYLALAQAGHGPAIAELGRDQGLARCDLTRAVFLDTETTGLSGWAGTLVFLVGLGSFAPRPDGGMEFQLRQFFLRDPDEEPAMLAAIAELVAGRPLVTFNGRAFDVPLLEGRYIMARHPSPLSGAPHLDLLPPARRLWRERVGSCALGSLEQSVLGVVRDQLNVPGALIPQLYADFLRTGDAREMPRVLYHNRIDVLSMVTLAAQLCRAFVDPFAPGTPAHDLLSLARWYDSRGREAEALRAYQAVPAATRDVGLRAAALRGLGFLLRRLGRRAEALEAWVQLALLADGDVTAHVELAKHYEWIEREPARAAEWTDAALARVARWPVAQRRAMEEELRHRQARLARKVGRGQ